MAILSYRKAFIVLVAAAAPLLAGCTKDPAFTDAGGITVEASIGAMTKVSAASSFEAGDKIAVYAWTGSAATVPAELVVDGVVNTLGSDGKWTPASQMLWKAGSDAHYFLGVSPVRAISDFTADAFTLSADYAANDLLFARKLDGLKPGAAPVALTFSHAMARLTVNVKLRGEFGASPAVSVSVAAKSGATVNYLTGAVTATGSASAVSLATASAPTGYTHGFSGIQVPQSGVRTVIITVDGRNYAYEAGEDIPLTSGHHTTLGLILGKDKLEVSGVSVSEWGAGGNLSGGAALAHHDGVDLGNGLLWAKCNIGAYNPWDAGDFFAWGETESKTTFTWANYKWMQEGKSAREYMIKYTFADMMYTIFPEVIWYDGHGFVGDYKKTFADSDYEDDAARQIWGGKWRIPTYEELEWLKDENHCDWEWTTNYQGIGAKGMIVTSKIPGYESNSIFLPVGGFRNGSVTEQLTLGYYWSSSLREASYDGGCIDFGLREGEAVPIKFVGCNERYIGSLLRPVADL